MDVFPELYPQEMGWKIAMIEQRKKIQLVVVQTNLDGCKLYEAASIH